MRRRLSILLVTVALFGITACASTKSESDRRESAQSNYDIGVVALSENEIPKAIAALKLAVEDEPQVARHHHALGSAYLRGEQYERAAESFRRAVEIDPRFSDAWNDLGVAYIRSQQWDLAVDALRHALSNPRYMTPENAHMNLGNAYYNLKRYDMALEEYRRLTDILPQSPDGYYLLGRTLIAQEKHAEAKEQLEQAVKLGSTIPVFSMELAKVLQRLGETDKARAIFQRVIDLNPRTPEAAEARRQLQQLR